MIMFLLGTCTVLVVLTALVFLAVGGVALRLNKLEGEMSGLGDRVTLLESKADAVEQRCDSSPPKMKTMWDDVLYRNDKGGRN